MQRNGILLIFGLVIICALFSFFGIDRSPVTWVDEVFYAEPARQMFLGGNLSSPIYFDVRDLDSKFFLHPPVHFFVQSLVFRLFGFSQFAVRIPPVLYYLISILFIYFTINQLLRQRSDSHIWALLGSAFFAFDNTIIAEARSGRSGSFSILLMLFSFYILNKRDLNTYIAVFASTLVGGIASLTHPASSFLIVGYFLNILCNRSFNGFRLKLLIVFSIALLICLVPYGLDVALNFSAWQNQFLAHTFASTGGLHDGKLQSLLRNFIDEFKLKPFALILILISMFSFNEKEFDSALLPLSGLILLAFTSTESFYKFILPIAYINAFALLPFSKDRFFSNGIRRFALIALTAASFINYTAFPSLRVFVIYSQWELRDPSKVNKILEQYIPEKSKVLSIPLTYYASISRNIDFKYPSTLYGLRIKRTDQDLMLFRSAVRNYKPNFLILDSAVNPVSEYGNLLTASYNRLFRYRADIKSNLNQGIVPVDFSIWEVQYAINSKGEK